MKIGVRTPSLKKSISARTKGRITRRIKSTFNPIYGKRGAGLLKPRKALYNRIYRRTSFSLGFLWLLFPIVLMWFAMYYTFWFMFWSFKAMWYISKLTVKIFYYIGSSIYIASKNLIHTIKERKQNLSK